MTYLIILLLSIIQSIFGTGILVFGTPLLIIFGYSFFESLNILLPASFSLSVIQIIQYGITKNISKKIIALSSLSIISGLIIAANLKLNIIYLLAIIFAGYIFLLRNSKAQETTAKLLTMHPNFGLVSIGLIHGATNLGGLFLSYFAKTIYINKYDVRRLISTFYALFVLVQIIFLYMIEKFTFSIETSFYSIISVLAYLILGNRIFQRFSDDSYRQFLQIIIVLFFITIAVRKIFY